jgi:predicted permease
MGFPILYAAYGDTGVLYGSIFNAVFNLLIWTYGVMLFSEDKGENNFKKLFLNAGILAVFAGLIIMIFSITLPYPLQETIRVVGNMTTPLSMIILGHMLTQIDIKSILNDKKVYYVCFIRLIVVPIITLAVLNLFKMDAIVRNVIVIGEAMPVASLCVIFAQNNDKEQEFASKIVFMSTILSVITIPVFTMMFL